MFALTRLTGLLPASKIVLSEGRQLYTLAMLDRDDPFKRVVGWGNDLIANDPGAWQKYLAKFPKAKDVADMGNPYAADVSMEKIAALGTEVYVLDLSNYFKAQETGLLGKLEKAGIATIFVDFRQDPTQNVLPSVQLLGRVLGREKEANAFAEYYIRQTRRIYARVGAIPDKKKPMVFIERAAGLLPCCATFGALNFGRYIEEAGGRNWGSQFFSGFQGDAAQEKVLSDNPDFYSRRRGIVTVVAIHDLSLAARFADRVLVMNAGRIAQAGAPENVLAHPAVSETYAVGVHLERSARGTLLVEPYIHGQ